MTGHELRISHFPVMYSMGLAAPSVSDALGSSKGVMPHDLWLLLHCHYNFMETVSEGGSFIGRENSHRIELGFRRRENS
jgi:hypothetical protein